MDTVISRPQRDATDPPPAGRAYVVAVLSVGVAVALRFALRPIVSTEAPFLLFFAAVMAAGWYGGFRPGLLATLLCAGTATSFFMEAVPASSDFEPTTWWEMRVAIFMLEGVITSALCGQLHTARLRAERSAAEARELERTVEQISEAEQRRIGQDLHDGLGQHLTGVAFLSKALQQKLAADGRADTAEAAATINQYMNEAIRWTRDLARGLAPMDLDHTSLPESLRELARKTSRMFSVECTYEGIETIQLPDDAMALNLYRVAQEAVSNGVKHGRAKRVTIDLDTNDVLMPGGLSLAVHDDGVGFEPKAYRPSPGGMGLLVMRYRAGVIGGRLDISSDGDGGTTVRCRVPASRVGTIPPPAKPDDWVVGTAAMTAARTLPGAFNIPGTQPVPTSHSHGTSAAAGNPADRLAPSLNNSQENLA